MVEESPTHAALSSRLGRHIFVGFLDEHDDPSCPKSILLFLTLTRLENQPHTQGVENIATFVGSVGFQMGKGVSRVV